ncbi:hypothetical protein Goklo_028978 [Gossypium klotzschianum]|uniref:Uncharacterized protein n=1 Tax=Gossypium klotzschianum TaxID=34286 RepID=A0A7J8WBU4_9ROSI|nr:hypothetical protein [Gossypium klotzschianum]
MEEYTGLLHCPRLQVDKAYSRTAYVPAFWKKLINITGISEQWIMARINIYGLMIFPRALGHVDEAVLDLFDRLGKGVTPILVILEGRQSFVSDFLWALLPVKRDSGYAKKERHIRRKLNSNPAKSSR